MTWLHLGTTLLDVAASLVEFAVNWLLQSTLLIAVGLAAGSLLARRGAAVQSAVYRTTMAAVLLCPIVGWMLLQAGVSGWSVALPKSWAYREAAPAIVMDVPAASESDFDVAPAVIDPVASTELTAGNSVSRERAEPAELATPVPMPPSIEQSQADTPAPLAERSAVGNVTVRSREIPAVSVQLFGWIAMFVCVIWSLITFTLIARLAIAWRRLSALRRDAARADASTMRACQELAARLAVAVPEVLRSPYLPSPCLAGIRRPAVLLPEAELSLSVRDVLVHELAHLARRDCHWNLLRQLSLSAFFFQPLLWTLSRRLESTAEDVCDDYVVAYGGDRQEYAHRLVDVAELSTAPIAAAGVGIVSVRSMLARRVLRMLDTSRALSTRVGRMLLSIVLAGGLFGTSIVGLLGVGPQRSAAEAAIAPAAGEAKDGDSQAGGSGETETAAAIDIANADDEPILVQGRVLDSAGRPVPAATVRLGRWYFSPAIERKPLAETESDGEGRFQTSYRKSQFNIDVKRENQWKEVVVSAFKQGFGPDWASCDELAPGEAAELRLPSDDLPITGRVLDLEGRPLAGVRVGVGTFQSPKAADLSEWVEAVKQGEHPWTAHTKMRDPGLPFEGTGLPSELVTDERGSFRLSGMGRERAIGLTFEGPTIVRTGVTAVTRKMAPLSLIRNTVKDSNDKLPVLGADFEIALPPTRAIEGVVTDAATSEPLAGVGVQSWRFAGGSSFIGERQIRTTTDEQGRFRLVGMPKGKKNEILAVPADDQPYFMHVSEVPDEPGLEPSTVKVELHRGIWITGRVTNLATGKPVAMAQLYFLPFLDNEFARATPEFGSDTGDDGTNAIQDRYQTAADGTFRLVGLPGRSIIGVLGAGEPYRQALGASDIKGMDAKGRFKTYSNPIQPSKKWPTAMKEIEPPKDATSVEVNFQLDPGQQVEITTIDPAGQPLSGVHVTGVTPRDYRRPIDSATIVAVAFGPDEERTILFHHDQRRLGKVIRTGAGDPPPKITVKLEPCATVKGRLVDENQVPITGAMIRFDVRPSQDFNRRLPATTTDSDGRFENAAVLPGVDYAVMSESAKTGFVTLADKVPVESGETVDLGTIDVTTKVRPAPTRVKAVAAAGVAGVAEAEKSAGTIATATSTAAASEASSEKTARTYVGQVVDPAGKPVAGSQVAVIGMKIESSRGGDLSPNGAILAQGVTDENGHFDLSGHLVSSKTHHYANLVARKDGLAIGWQQINLDANVTDAKLALAPEEPIRGRLIDIEGQPAAGVRLAVRSLMKRGANGSMSAGGVGFQGDDVPTAWLQAVTSDSDGRFTLAGIPTEHGLLLDVAGGERFAPQSISLNTGMPEQRGERDATYRPIVKNVVPGEEAVLALAPAQLFEGVIRYEDTGEPAPYARLTIWASQQDQVGSMSSVPGQADEQGRYRISPHPGVRFGVTAYPPDGAPYLARETPIDKAYRWQAGDRVKQVDVKLPRGVLVRGTVVETGTNIPVAGATIQYIPESKGKPRAAEGVLTGWQGIQISGADGKFQIPVLPGPGRLLVHGPHGKYVLLETSERELSRGQRGGRRNYAHAIERIDPAEGTDTMEATISIRLGETVTGRIVDQQGVSIDEALIVSRLEIDPKSPFFRGYRVPTLGGKFELAGLDPEQEYPVYFLDPKRKLGAAQVVRAGNTDLSIVLAPCGQATARFLDPEGQPQTRFYPPLHMVVTPGEIENENIAYTLGKLTADEDFNSNIDQVNYMPALKTDKDGRITFPALIPGATYQLPIYKNGKRIILKTFSVKSGETIELGDMTVDVSGG